MVAVDYSDFQYCHSCKMKYGTVLICQKKGYFCPTAMIYCITAMTLPSNASLNFSQVCQRQTLKFLERMGKCVYCVFLTGHIASPALGQNTDNDHAYGHSCSKLLPEGKSLWCAKAREKAQCRRWPHRNKCSALK